MSVAMPYALAFLDLPFRADTERAWENEDEIAEKRRASRD